MYNHQTVINFLGVKFFLHLKLGGLCHTHQQTALLLEERYLDHHDNKVNFGCCPAKVSPRSEGFYLVALHALIT